jgi:serine/threonine protein kinase
MWPAAKAPASPAGPSSELVLQKGFGRRVVREADGSTVRKTFHSGSLADRQRTAAEELSRLIRFSAALADVPGASCPVPSGPVLEPEPGYRMSWVAGEDLVDHLDRRVLPEEDLAEIGRTIARALVAYVSAVAEPYWDLKLGNILLRPDGDLVFVDFGPPQDHEVPPGPETPYETSVGNLLANLVFESARPRSFLHRRMHRQSAGVAATLVDALREGGQPLREEVLLAAAQRAYRRSTFGRRSLARTAWYATAGRAIALPVRTAAGVVGPASLRAAEPVDKPPG